MFSCCILRQEKPVQLKFRLSGGTVIGPFTYSLEATGSQLKSAVFSKWPKDHRHYRTKRLKDLHLFYGRRPLEDKMELQELVGDHHPTGEILTIEVYLVDATSNRNRCSSFTSE